MMKKSNGKVKTIFTTNDLFTLYIESPKNVLSPYLGDTYTAKVASSPIKCAKCKHELIHEGTVVEHEKGEGSNMWEEDPSLIKGCDLKFLLPHSWMSDISTGAGSLVCSSCKSEVGAWDWEGKKCRCGFKCKPAFVVFLDKVAL